jgi:hypothetical protein
MANTDEAINPEEFSNLILDDTPITEVTAEDNIYLNQFINLEKMCMNATGLKSLKNLPEKLGINTVSITYLI